MLVSAVVGGVVAMMSGVACYYDRGRSLRRAARRMPLTALRDVLDGARVKVVGRVVLLDDPLASPITLRRCAGYRVELQALDEARRVLVTEERALEFLLCDDSGAHAHVRANLADVVYAPDAELRVSRAQAPSAALVAFLAKHRQPAHGRSQRPLSYLFREAVLAPDQIVTIVGRARHEIDRDGRNGSYRALPTRLVFDAPDDLCIV